MTLRLEDSASTLAGEVQEPRKVFPQALFLAMVLVIASYVLPLLVGVGALALAPLILGVVEVGAENGVVEMEVFFLFGNRGGL